MSSPTKWAITSRQLLGTSTDQVHKPATAASPKARGQPSFGPPRTPGRLSTPGPVGPPRREKVGYPRGGRHARRPSTAANAIGDDRLQKQAPADTWSMDGLHPRHLRTTHALVPEGIPLRTNSTTATPSRFPTPTRCRAAAPSLPTFAMVPREFDAFRHLVGNQIQGFAVRLFPSHRRRLLCGAATNRSFFGPIPRISRVTNSQLSTSAMSQVNIAIIGLGFGAEFIPIYQRHPQANMYAICQRTEESLNEIGEKYGVEKRFTRNSTTSCAIPTSPRSTSTPPFPITASSPSRPSRPASTWPAPSRWPPA